VQVWLVSRGPGQPHFIVLINIVQVVAAGLVLLMLRLPGYRIGHHSQSPASPFDE
jgi:hypothetical protein